MAVTPNYFDDGRIGAFYSDTSLAEGLSAAQEHSKNGGFVASMPWLVHQRVLLDKSDWVWQKSYDCFSEEDVFADVDGEFSGLGFSIGEELVAFVHGGGVAFDRLVAQKKSSNAYDITPKLICEYILNRIPHERVYCLDDILNAVPPLVFPLVVIASADKLRKLKNGSLNRYEFVDNEIVAARSLLSREQRTHYFEKASFNGQLANWHSFVLNVGRVPHLSSYGNCGGFSGDNYVNYFARPVGVAPEAPSVAREWIAEQQRNSAQNLTPQTRRPQVRQQPIFVAGDGFVPPRNPPTPEMLQPKKDYKNIATNQDLGKWGETLSETQQDALRDIITRFKNLE